MQRFNIEQMLIGCSSAGILANFDEWLNSVVGDANAQDKCKIPTSFKLELIACVGTTKTKLISINAACVLAISYVIPLVVIVRQL